MGQGVNLLNPINNKIGVYTMSNYIHKNMSTTQTQAATVKLTIKERRMNREIKNYQESANTFLPQATFRRLVASTTREQVGDGIRFNGQSIKALQTAAEDEITRVFEGANILAHQAGRDTVTPLDVKTFQVLRNM
jgi:histone H3/H4